MHPGILQLSILFLCPVLCPVAAMAGATPAATSSVVTAFIEAEALQEALDHSGALRRYREGLESLAATPPGERTPASWTGEAALALLEVESLAAGQTAYAAVRPMFEHWMDPKLAGDANLAALARYLAGKAARAAGDTAGSEAAWRELGFLQAFHVIGPFDNERGGGFGTAYPPEEEALAAAKGGRLLRPDPALTYPGKVRPVSWRKLTLPLSAGRVDLDELLRPNDEALAYALAFVESDADKPAALRVGSDEGVRVWVNGALVLSRDVHRPLRFDQDVIPIRLARGWSSILLKVSEAKGGWGFRARLTSPDGSPLAGWRQGEPPADAPAAAVPDGSAPDAAAPAGKEAAVKTGPRQTLEELAVAGQAGDREVYVLGALHLRLRSHDDGEHPDRERLRQAISLCRGPVPAAYHRKLAQSCVRERLTAAERDDNDWREALEAAMRTEPPSIRAALELARHSLGSFGNLQKASSLLDRVLSARPTDPEAILLAGEIESARGFPLASPRALEKARAAVGAALIPSAPAPSITVPTPALDAAKLPELMPAALCLREVDRLRREGQLDSAQALLEALLARNRLDGDARRRLVGIHLARGRADEALALLKEAEKLEPFEAAARLERARVLDGLERPAEAFAAIEAALEIAPEDHEILAQAGNLLRRLGRDEDAFRAWDRALAIQPNFPSLREYADFARRVRDEFAERYRRDVAGLAARALEEPLAGATAVLPAAKVGDDPVRVLLDLTAVRVHQDGTVKEFRQYVARAMNDRGLRLLGRYSTAYARGEQRVAFKAGRVYRPGGQVEEARLTVHGGSPSEGGSWSNASIDLPPVRAGDVVEVQYVTEDLRQSFFGDYFGRRERLSGQFPIAERVYIIEAPAGRKLHFHQRNLELAPTVTQQKSEEGDAAAATDVYTWKLNDLEAARPEPGMPPPDEKDPVIDVSTFASWEQFSRWYSNLIREQFEVSPPIRAKVEELTSGLQRDEDKIRAVYDFVTKDIRYNAWPFGVHGFKPYNAPTIFQRRFGDCKDKSTLICTMLGAAGIRAQPVLIYATDDRGDEDLTMPMVEHFNHCIAYVPPTGGRPGLYLDGTAETHAVDELPVMDRGARVLLVSDDRGEVAQVPWNRPEEQGSEEEIQVSIEPDRGAVLRVRARARGDEAANLRRLFEVPGRRRIELERIYGARFGGVIVESEDFPDLARRSGPVEFSVTLRVPGFVVPSPEGEVAPVLDDFFRTAERFAGLAALDERQQDLLLGPPWRGSLRVVYHLPQGQRAGALPPDRESSGRFGRLQVRCQGTEEGGKHAVVLTRLIEITANRVAKADYPEFRELISALVRLRGEKVLIAGAKSEKAAPEKAKKESP